ncbi:MAG: TraE/TraK family type IV conjugative transfer system protein [Sulfuricaulis sp.]
MKAEIYRDSFEGMRSERRMTRLTLLGLTLALVLCLFYIATREATVVLVPPGLTEKGDITKNDANSAVKEAWGAYIAETLGNVTPQNADFVARNLGSLIDPAVYKKLMSVIGQQAQLIKDEQVTIQFADNAVFYVPSKDIVVVSGEYTMRGMRDEETRKVMTYELGLRVRNYHVALTSLDLYEGPWRPGVDREKEAKEKAQRKVAER